MNNARTSVITTARDPDAPSKIIEPGLGIHLDEGRCVACFRMEDGGYVWELSRTIDGAPRVTSMRVSPEALYAMAVLAQKMIKTYPHHAASVDISLASKKPAKKKSKA